MVPDQLEELLPKTPADLEFRAGENYGVFGHNGIGNIPTSGLSHSKQDHGPLQPLRFECCGYDHIGVNHQAKGNHQRLDFRAVLMICSISLAPKRLVPCCLDS